MTDDEFTKEEKAKFATEVIELYQAATEGSALKQQRNNSDVRRAAFGLVALKQLVDREMLRFRSDPERLNETGILEAAAIIDALTTGREHPVWQHIKAMQSEKYRRGLTPPVDRGQRSRDMLAGLVLAYQKQANVKLAPAIDAVHKGIRSDDFSFTPGQLRQYVNRGGAAAQDFARSFLRYEAEVPKDVTDPGDRILIVGRAELSPYLSVPVLDPLKSIEPIFRFSPPEVI